VASNVHLTSAHARTYAVALQTSQLWLNPNFSMGIFIQYYETLGNKQRISYPSILSRTGTQLARRGALLDPLFKHT